MSLDGRGGISAVRDEFAMAFTVSSLRDLSSSRLEGEGRRRRCAAECAVSGVQDRSDRFAGGWERWRRWTQVERREHVLLGMCSGDGEGRVRDRHEIGAVCISALRRAQQAVRSAQATWSCSLFTESVSFPCYDRRRTDRMLQLPEVSKRRRKRRTRISTTPIAILRTSSA